MIDHVARHRRQHEFAAGKGRDKAGVWNGEWERTSEGMKRRGMWSETGGGATVAWVGARQMREWSEGMVERSPEEGWRAHVEGGWNRHPVVTCLSIHLAFTSRATPAWRNFAQRSCEGDLSRARARKSRSGGKRSRLRARRDRNSRSIGDPQGLLRRVVGPLLGEKSEQCDQCWQIGDRTPRIQTAVYEVPRGCANVGIAIPLEGSPVSRASTTWRAPASISISHTRDRDPRWSRDRAPRLTPTRLAIKSIKSSAGLSSAG